MTTSSIRLDSCNARFTVNTSRELEETIQAGLSSVITVRISG